MVGKRKGILASLVVFLTSVSSLSLHAQVLDSSFGVNGIVKMPFDANGGGSIQSVAQQADGKIIAAGGAKSSFAIIRYHSNGTVDSSFASNGRLIKQFNGHFGGANNVLIQPDNKIIVSGTALGSNSNFAIARFNQDGTPDLSFNGTGDAVIDISSKDHCNGMALQPDGKIILCGERSLMPNNAVTVIRLNPDGTVDSAFNNGQGIFYAQYGIWSSRLNEVIVKPDGKIIACGNVNNNSTDFLLIQLLPDGQLDSAFGTNGVVITPNTGFGHDFALQPDGKIVIVGRDVATGGHMVRYMPDGSIDNNFGTNGHVLITHPLGLPGPEQVEIDNDGKIYAAGYIDTGNEEMYLVRFNTDGSIDNTYAHYGIITSLSPQQERTHAMLIQQDGKILMAGSVSVNFSGNFGMLRFWPFPLSINAINNKQDLKIFPNPATNVLHLDDVRFITGRDTYTIFSSTGEVLQAGVLLSPLINIINIPKGVYIIQITDRKSGSTTYARFCKL